MPLLRRHPLFHSPTKAPILPGVVTSCVKLCHLQVQAAACAPGSKLTLATSDARWHAAPCASLHLPLGAALHQGTQPRPLLLTCTCTGMAAALMYCSPQSSESNTRTQGCYTARLVHLLRCYMLKQCSANPAVCRLLDTHAHAAPIHTQTGFVHHLLPRARLARCLLLVCCCCSPAALPPVLAQLPAPAGCIGCRWPVRCCWEN